MTPGHARADDTEPFTSSTLDGAHASWVGGDSVVYAAAIAELNAYLELRVPKG